MRCVVPVLSAATFTATFAAMLAAPTSALAGGIGLLGSGGIHQATAYYYQNGDPDLQGKDVQMRPNAGFGGELIIGDRDDRVLGLMRLSFNGDWPVNEPDTSAEDQSHEYIYPPAHEQGVRQVGTLLVGIQWGLWGDPTGFQLTAVTLAGSGFATLDNTEYLIIDPGLGFTYGFNKGVQTFVNVTGTTRYRKSWDFGGSAHAGLRYLFD